MEFVGGLLFFIVAFGSLGSIAFFTWRRVWNTAKQEGRNELLTHFIMRHYEGVDDDGEIVVPADEIQGHIYHVWGSIISVNEIQAIIDKEAR